MKRILATLLALLLAGPTFAQSAGTLNLLGPSSTPPAPQILRVDQLNGPINAALTAKADVANPVFTGTLTAPVGAFTTLTASASVSGVGFTALLAPYAPLASPTFTGTINGAAAALTGTLTLGAGGAGGQFIQGSGTGNMVVKPGGTSSIVNFLSGAGNAVLQLGGASETITTQKTLALQGTGAWTGTAISGNAAIFMNQNLSGTVTGPNEVAPLYLQVASDTVTSTAGLPVAFISHSFGGAAMTGGRFGMDIVNNLTTRTGNTDAAYTALRVSGLSSANEGGTAGAGNGKASIFSFNTVAHLNAAATFYHGLIGYELDVQADAGSSAEIKAGLLVVQTVGDAVPGSTDDGAIIINNQSLAGTTTTGWKTGLSLGGALGHWPFLSTSTLIKIVPGATDAASAILADTGLDFTGIFAFTTAAIKTPGFTVDPTGNATALTFKVGANKVVGARDTGWTAMTGTPDKATAFATSTVTLAQLAGRMMSLQAALTTHGLIGP